VLSVWTKLTTLIIKMLLNSEDMLLKELRFSLEESQAVAQSTRDSSQLLSREQDTLLYFHTALTN